MIKCDFCTYYNPRAKTCHGKDERGFLCRDAIQEFSEYLRREQDARINFSKNKRTKNININKNTKSYKR